MNDFETCQNCKHVNLHITDDPCGDCNHGNGGSRSSSEWETPTPESTPSTPYLMPLETLLALHKSTCESGLETMRKKNHDYTNGSAGVFDNFKGSEFLDIHPVMGIMLRIQDKMKRIQTFVSQGTLAVEGEGVFDAIEDTINYMILIKGIITEEQTNKEITI